MIKRHRKIEMKYSINYLRVLTLLLVLTSLPAAAGGQPTEVADLPWSSTISDQPSETDWLAEARKIATEDPVASSLVYEQALDIYGADPEVLMEYTQVLIQSKDISKAAQYALLIWQIKPTLEVARTLVRLQYQAGMPEQSAISAEVALERFPTDTELLILGAEVFAETGLKELALSAADELLKFEPVDINAALAASRVLWSSGRPVQAWKVLAESQARTGFSPEAEELQQKILESSLDGHDAILILPDGWTVSGSQAWSTDGQFLTFWVDSIPDDAEEAAKSAVLNNMGLAQDDLGYMDQAGEKELLPTYSLETIEFPGGAAGAILGLEFSVPDNQGISMSSFSGAIAVPVEGGSALVVLETDSEDRERIQQILNELAYSIMAGSSE